MSAPAEKQAGSLSLVISDLIQRGPQLRAEVPWQPFHPGIRIHRLYGGENGPAAALLCFEPGARVPPHQHLGYEHILVLDGAQSDERGTYPAGTFVVNPPETVHRVYSATGCVALLIWERGVGFLPSDASLSPS